MSGGPNGEGPLSDDEVRQLLEQLDDPTRAPFEPLPDDEPDGYFDE